MYNETFKNDYLWFVGVIVNFAYIERERQREIKLPNSVYCSLPKRSTLNTFSLY
jgi:hypothetical protein